jgi:hypothetical protein
MIVSQPKGMLEAWFRLKTGLNHRIEDCSYLGEMDCDHTINCVIVFHNHDGRDIEIDVPPTPVSRALLRATRNYVVIQLKCDRVTFKFRADNDRSRHAAERLGARHEGSIRRFYPDGQAQLVYGLLKEDFRLG